MTFTFLQKDVRLDDIPNNANGDGNLDYLSLSVKVANLLVVANLSVGYSFCGKSFLAVNISVVKKQQCYNNYISLYMKVIMVVNNCHEHIVRHCQ